MRTRILVALAAMLCLIPLRASAVTLVFASFSYAGPATVTYDQSTGILSGTNIPINFSYVAAGAPAVGVPATGYGTQSATLNFTATRLGDVFSGFGIGAQELKLNTFSITRDTPFSGKSNLLAGNASKGVLHGALGGSVANYDASMSGGASISYFSDFLAFPPPTDADLSWAVESIGPPLAVSGTNFRTFNASIAGTFGYNAKASNIPEGSSLFLMAGGLAPIVFLLRSRRRNT